MSIEPPSPDQPSDEVPESEAVAPRGIDITAQIDGPIARYAIQLPGGEKHAMAIPKKLFAAMVNVFTQALATSTEEPVQNPLVLSAASSPSASGPIPGLPTCCPAHAVAEVQYLRYCERVLYCLLAQAGGVLAVSSATLESTNVEALRMIALSGHAGGLNLCLQPKPSTGHDGQH